MTKLESTTMGGALDEVVRAARNLRTAEVNVAGCLTKQDFKTLREAEKLFDELREAEKLFDELREAFMQKYGKMQKEHSRGHV